jgi:hypothetical protein
MSNRSMTPEEFGEWFGKDYSHAKDRQAERDLEEEETLP